MEDTSKAGDGREAVYGLPVVPEWTARTEENAKVEGWTGAARWGAFAERFMEPPAIGTRVLITFNGFGLGTVVAYFVEHGWLGIEVKCDQWPAWHVAQNPGQHNPLVFGAEVKPAPAVVLARAAGGHKRHARIEGSLTALCGFKPSSPHDRQQASGLRQKSRAGWHSMADGTAPNGNGYGCAKCLAHPSSSMLAYFNDQRHRDADADRDASAEYLTVGRVANGPRGRT